MNQRFEADVISAFGRHLLARDAAGTLLRARPFGRSLSIVCGDRVLCEHGTGGEVHAVEILPRRTALYRSNARGVSEAVVANLSQSLIVVAALPRPDMFMIDRYLSAAASTDITARIVVNKSDLALDESDEHELAYLGRLGYRIDRVSAHAGTGMDALVAALVNHTSVLVGQSGVGKSSLIRKLTADGGDAVTGELMRAEQGRHTTTASRRYDCPDGGFLIDSPGVRDFAPSIDHLESKSLGFHEVQQHSAGCRFQDCQHLNEPKCAVREAVEAGSFSARRYESYRRLRRLYDKLRGERAPGLGAGQRGRH